MAFLIAFFIPLLLNPLFMLFGIKDIPNHRSSHHTPTPRGGGVPVILGFLIAWIISPGELFHFPTHFTLIIIGIILVTGIGWADDLLNHGVSYKKRLICQIIGTLLCLWGIFSCGIPPENMLIKGGCFFFLTLVLINGANFIDGLNGMLILNSIVTLLGMFLITTFDAYDNHALADVCLFFLLACLGFLPYNFPKARLFIGDSGSTSIGLVMGILTCMICKNEEPTSLWCTLYRVITLLLPFGFVLFDVSITLLRRLWLKRSITQAHRDHLFHLLHRAGLSHTHVSGLYALCALIVVMTLFYTNIWVALGIYSILQTLIVVFTRHKTKKKHIIW